MLQMYNRFFIYKYIKHYLLSLFVSINYTFSNFQYYKACRIQYFVTYDIQIF